MKYIDADLLRKEIERRITDNTFGAKLELIDILAWLDTLSEEPDKSLEEDLEKEIERYGKKSMWLILGEEGISKCAHHFYELGQSQMPMPEDTVLFNKGVAEGRRLEREDMLGDAISCEIDWYDGPILNYPIDQLCEVLSKMDIDVGDKIRIVVLKEEEE